MSNHEHTHDEKGDREHVHEHHDDHAHKTGLPGFLDSIFKPHSHDHADSLDSALLVSKEGTRALAVSLIVLLITAVIQAVIFAFSGSVALLADTIHNFSDALTAIPLAFAFVVARRLPTRRYTYGLGWAEDLAGLFVVAVIALSVVVTAWQAIDRFFHPQPVSYLWWVVAAGIVGFIGNEWAARYRITVGRKIGSAALVADGLHARTDGFTSLAVVAGAIGVALGWDSADPIVGLLISVAIAVVLKSAARDVYHRLMDAVDPELVDRVENYVAHSDGVVAVDSVRIRWIGHELHAQVEIATDPALTVAAAHDITEDVHHALLDNVPRLTNAIIHVNPHGVPDAHRLTAHHRDG